jgi:drug/metabolite transporter (DMT)-like permease
MSSSEDAKDLIRSAVVRAVSAAAASPVTTTSPGDVSTITAKVLTEVAPIVVNASNQEPWYQSRVTWGAIASIVLPLLGILGVSTDVINADQLVALGMALGTVVGGVVTLYGRWVAKKPLGN